MTLRDIYHSIIPYEWRFQFYKLRHLREMQELRSHVYPSEKGNFSLRPFDQNHCLFIHITKTAGTSVAKSLFSYLPYHYTAIEYRVIYGRSDFDRYFKFAFVRNPWDRLYSAYRYLKAGGWDEGDRIWAEENIGHIKDFDEFVSRWLSIENMHKHLHFKPQHEFICDSRGRMLVNYLAYFETLQDDFKRVCRHMDIDAELGCHNANPGLGYQDVYTEETRQKVAEIYAQDIALFGYDFNGIAHRQIADLPPEDLAGTSS